MSTEITDLQMLANVLAQPNATQVLANRIFNGNGGKAWQRNGTQRRLNRATVSLGGIELDCEYDLEGAFYPATPDEPAALPMCVLESASVGGVDVMPLLSDAQVMELQEKIERQWEEVAL